MELNQYEPYARRRWLALGASVLMVGALAATAGAQEPVRQRAALADGHAQVDRSADRSWGAPPWLKWPLAGLGIASAITGATAWQVRERFADRWNSDACLRGGLTRIQACSSDYHEGKRMERVSWVGGVASVVLSSGAVISWLTESPHRDPTRSATACSFSGWGGVCSGSF